MGAVDFEIAMTIKGNANDAYKSIIQEDREENGHQQGYSGTIGSADHYQMITDHPRTGTKAFDKWLQYQLDEILCKRDCRCIEFSKASTKRIKERRGLKGRKGYRSFLFFGVAPE